VFASGYRQARVDGGAATAVAVAVATGRAGLCLQVSGTEGRVCKMTDLSVLNRTALRCPASAPADVQHRTALHCTALHHTTLQ
jgi:hypothetical protein